MPVTCGAGSRRDDFPGRAACRERPKENRADASQELWAVSKTVRSLRLLTRFVESGHEVIAAYVLTMLGGPMEQMESWGPPGSNKRRPCKVTVSNHGKAPLYTAHLGSPENWHATD